MLATHIEAENRYESFRKMAREAIHQELPYGDRGNIKLTEISQSALIYSKIWAADLNRKVDWPWSEGYKSYAFRYPNRFELATWYGSALAGLSLGRPSYAGTRLRLEFIEANPSGSPLKGRIIPITISVAELYANIIGASELRIIDPIDKKLIEYYSSFGYRYCSGRTESNQKHYLVKVLS